MAKERLVLVTGNGRSGTLTMTHVLRKAFDIDVGHEYVREDGCCSLYFFDERFTAYPVIPWGPPKGLNAHVGQKMTDYQFKTIFHQVRNPLKCIPSMAMIYSRPIMDWFEQMDVVPAGIKPRLLKSMMIWHEVNKRTEKIADMRYRIEDVKDDVVWGRICRRLKMSLATPYPDMKPKHRATGSRNKIITIDDLYMLDKRLTRNIIKMAHRYGY